MVGAGIDSGGVRLSLGTDVALALNDAVPIALATADITGHNIIVGVSDSCIIIGCVCVSIVAGCGA